MQCTYSNEAASLFPLYPRMRNIIKRKVRSILDFGCGEGDLTFVLHALFDDSNLEKIIGYDSNKLRIEKAKEKLKKRCGLYNKLKFTYEEQSEKYNLVTFNFVLHHDVSLINTTLDLIDSNGFIAIIDYHMKDIDKNAFKESFKSNKELEELNMYGFEKSFQLHTKFSLEDYLEMLNDSKLTLIEYKVNSNKFLMVCQKKKEIL